MQKKLKRLLITCHMQLVAYVYDTMSKLKGRKEEREEERESGGREEEREERKKAKE